MDEVRGFAPVSYSAGISAFEKGEQWRRALALFSEMAWLEAVIIGYRAGTCSPRAP